MSADVPETWEELARAAVADLRNYSHDEDPARRLVSANYYDVILKALADGSDPIAASKSHMSDDDIW